MTTSGLRGSILVLLMSLAGCAAVQAPRPQPHHETSERMPSPATTFIVVRHAEKVGDGSRDPPLSAIGIASARRLATALHAEPMIAVYATPFLRTRQTASATAADHGLAVIPYAADQPAAALAAQLRERHAGGTVLVVGHSNTAPGIAAALCACAATPLGDDDYGRVYRVAIDAGDRVLLEETVLR